MLQRCPYQDDETGAWEKLQVHTKFFRKTRRKETTWEN
jgi:hypothetical protein